VITIATTSMIILSLMSYFCSRWSIISVQ